MDDAAQAFLKTKIMDNIHKYFYLIVFTAYLREQASVAKDGVSEEEKKTFSLTGGKGKVKGHQYLTNAIHTFLARLSFYVKRKQSFKANN